MFCTNCGKKVMEGAAFCDECGAALNKNQKQVNQQVNQQVNTQSSNNKVLAILSYFGILCLIPYLANKDNDPFVAFHAKQGLNLFIIDIIFSIIVSIIKTAFGDSFIAIAANIVPILISILSIIGLVYACEGKMKELPIISSIKIVK